MGSSQLAGARCDSDSEAGRHAALEPGRRTDAMTVYTLGQRIAHWVSTIVLALLFGLGLSITRLLDGDIQLVAYAWHEWLGLSLLLITMIRVTLWTHGTPPAPDLPGFEALARRFVHGAMYALLVAVPLSGWCMTQAFGFPIVYLGILPLPAVIGEDRELAVWLRTIHTALATGLAALIGLHLGALARHHFVKQDGILTRMWPGNGSDA